MNQWDASKYLFSNIPDRCQEYIPAALSGDPDSAEAVIYVAPDRQRGKICRAFFELGMAPEAFRKALTTTWDDDHVNLFHAFGSDFRKLKKAFRYADFETSHLPSKFTIYRGGSGDFHTIAGGVSWTRNRDCACWFAMYNAGRFKGAPIVLRREVTRRDVLAHINSRGEDEIVVAGAAHAFVDANLAAWQQGDERFRMHIKKETSCS